MPHFPLEVFAFHARVSITSIFCNPAATEDHIRGSSCFICAIFSHGGWRHLRPVGESIQHITDVIWATNRQVPLEQLMRPLSPDSAPHLCDKPKNIYYQCEHGITYE